MLSVGRKGVTELAFGVVKRFVKAIEIVLGNRALGLIPLIPNNDLFREHRVPCPVHYPNTEELPSHLERRVEEPLVQARGLVGPALPSRGIQILNLLRVLGGQVFPLRSAERDQCISAALNVLGGVLPGRLSFSLLLVVTIACVRLQNAAQLAPKGVPVVRQLLGGVLGLAKVRGRVFSHGVPAGGNALLVEVDRKVERRRQGRLTPSVAHLDRVLVEVPSGKGRDGDNNQQQEQPSAEPPSLPRRGGVGPIPRFKVMPDRLGLPSTPAECLKKSHDRPRDE